MLFAFSAESPDGLIQDGAASIPLLCRSCPEVPFSMNDVVEAAVCIGMLYLAPPTMFVAFAAKVALSAVAAFPAIVFVAVRLDILAVEIVLFVTVSFVIVAVSATKLLISDVPETVSFVIVAFVIVAVGVVKLVMFAAISFPRVTLLIVPPAIDAFSMFALFIFAWSMSSVSTKVVLGDRSEVCE